MVDLEDLDRSGRDSPGCTSSLERHARRRPAARGPSGMLAGWGGAVQPLRQGDAACDYKRMIVAIDKASHDGLSGEMALMAAFEQNNLDLSRVSGN